MSKFKIGDKVRVVKSIADILEAEKTIGEIGTIIDTKFSEVYPYNVKFEKLELTKMLPIFAEEELELFEEKTEFTFQELISRNVPGVYKECTNNGFRVEKVEIKEDGNINISADFCALDSLKLPLCIPSEAKFKFEEPKQTYQLIEVVHAVNGKTYTFRERVLNPFNDYLKPHEFVICDTSMGNTFGRVAGTVEKELTKNEFLEYKECWRAE